MMRIKNNRINLLISKEHDFAECEINLFGTTWYHLYISLADNMLLALNEYNIGEIGLLELLEYWYMTLIPILRDYGVVTRDPDSIRFDDESGKYKPHEFTTEEWEYILEGL